MQNHFWLNSNCSTKSRRCTLKPWIRWSRYPLSSWASSVAKAATKSWNKGVWVLADSEPWPPRSMGRMWCHKEVLETSKTWAHHYQERLTLRLQVSSVLDLWARQLCQWQRDLRGDSGSAHIWHVELTQNIATSEHATRTKCLALRPFITWHWVNWVILATTNGVVVSLGSQTQKPSIPTTKVTIALKVLAYAGCTHLAVKQNCLYQWFQGRRLCVVWDVMMQKAISCDEDVFDISVW